MPDEEVVRVGDRMWISVEIIHDIASNGWIRQVRTRVHAIRTEEDGTKTLVMMCDPKTADDVRV